jgi:hypothetical protein
MVAVRAGISLTHWAARTAHVMHTYDENWANWNFQIISETDEQEMLESWANLRKLAAEGDGEARDCSWRTACCYIWGGPHVVGRMRLKG